jgi:hypothetical protein
MDTLRWGSLGEDVNTLRNYLLDAGFSAGCSVESARVFDWHLYTRLLQFQIKMVRSDPSWSLNDIDGICGPKTWAALQKIREENNTPPTNPVPPTEFKPVVDTVVASPNYSERGATLTHIILHNTAGSYDGAVSWLANRNSGVSAHLVISRGGHVTQMVAFANKAWHAGNARMNANGIGIEIEATTSQQGLTPVQEGKLVAWVKHLMKTYNIPAENVGIHRWYSNTTCPVLIWPTDESFRAWRKKHFGQ